MKNNQSYDSELINLPPKWKIKEKNGYFEYYDENGDMHFQNVKDNNTTRMYCWAVYNKIEK